jgi:hypothetical protein
MDREQFLGAQFARAEQVTLPNGAGNVYVRVMSGAERDKFSAERERAGKVDPNGMGYFVCLVLSDADGNRILKSSDVKSVMEKPAAVLDAIIDAAMKLNGMADDAVEDAEKN